MAIEPEFDPVGRPYFVRRPAPEELRFEENYWGNGRDPDGNRRDHYSERQRRLEDLKTELSFINSLPPGRILDVGCGLGHLLSGVAEGWDKHGVEISRTAARHATQYGTIRDCDLKSANYPEGHFDAIVSYHVMEHMLDPVAELSEMMRALRPGGYLVVGVPNFDGACARRFGAQYRMLHDPTHISLFSEHSLRQMLLDEGLQVLRTDFPYFDTPHFTPDNLMRLSDERAVSPPFWGNIMTFYTRKPESAALLRLRRAGRAAARIAAEQGDAVARLASALQRAQSARAPIVLAPAAQQLLASLPRSIGLANPGSSVVSIDAVRLGLGLEDLQRHTRAPTEPGSKPPLFCFLPEKDATEGARDQCQHAGGELIPIPRPESTLLGPVARLLLEALSPEETTDPS